MSDVTWWNEKNAVQNKKAINENTKKHIPSQKGSKVNEWK